MILLIVVLLLLPATALAQDAVTQQRCLAEAIYYEARSEGWKGMVAVGVVIQNRVAHRKYPDTICEVVKQGRYWQGNPIRDKCQFSYYCDGKPERPAEKEAWITAREIAQLLLISRLEIEIAGLENATHYHSTSVTPFWSKVLERCLQIGDHVFYVRK
jgi:spore germination cell wall hydrolase CwlJ-like protein